MTLSANNRGSLLITGAKGSLGKELIKVFPDAIGTGRGEFDITDYNSVEAFINKTRPAMVIHAAALVDVIKCEKDKDLAWQTNVLGTENIVNALNKFVPDAYFIYISTACVFRGDRGNYTEEDIPYPANFYSLTKLLGEFTVKKMENSLVVRTNFVPKAPWPHENAFTDRWGTYLFADGVARAIKDVIDKNMKGIVHVCGSKKMSMFELAKLVSPEVKPFTIQEYSLISGVHLTQDMTLKTIRIKPYDINP